MGGAELGDAHGIGRPPADARSNECKKRKLKCIPTGDECQRCIAGGVACVFAARPPAQGAKTARLANMRMHVLADASSHHHVRALTDDMVRLRQQVAELARTVGELKDGPSASPQSRTPTPTPGPSSAAAAPLPPGTVSAPASAYAASPSTAALRGSIPKNPRFVGPTRPAFGLLVAERSLTRMGIPAPEPTTPSSEAPSDAASPLAAAYDADVADADAAFWARCSPAELAQLLAVFEEEVESVYPYVDTMALAARAEHILLAIRGPADAALADGLSVFDVDMARLAVANAVAVEEHGWTALSAAIADSVDARLTQMRKGPVDLREIQLYMTLASHPVSPRQRRRHTR